MVDMLCPTRADHDWAGEVFLEAGRHPTLGHYQTYQRRCYRCGKREVTTDWVVAGLPAFDKVRTEQPAR